MSLERSGSVQLPKRSPAAAAVGHSSPLSRSASESAARLRGGLRHSDSIVQGERFDLLWARLLKETDLRELASVLGTKREGVMTRFSRARGLERVIAAMKANEGDEGIVAQSAHALGVSVAGPGGQFFIEKFDVIAFLAEAMRRFRGSGAVQEGCAKALAAIAAVSGDNRKEIGRQGAHMCLVEALRTHAGSASVSAAALDAVSACSADSAIENKIVKSGGTMEQHADDAELSAKGCNALRNLGDSSATQARVAREGAIPVLLNAMERYPHSTSVNEACVGALGSLALGGAENRAAMANGRSAQKVTEALREHSSSPSLVAQCCRALENLAKDTVVKREIGASGALPLIVDAMRTHSDDAVLQRRAACAVTALGDIPENRRILLEAGGEDVIDASIRRHRSNPSVHAYAQLALRTIVRSR